MCEGCVQTYKKCRFEGLCRFFPASSHDLLCLKPLLYCNSGSDMAFIGILSTEKYTH